MKNNQLMRETSGLAMPAQSSESEVIETLESIPSVERRRGNDVRKSFNNRYKAHAIWLVERGEKAINVGEHLNVSRGQISKWLKLKDKILQTKQKVQRVIQSYECQVFRRKKQRTMC